MLAKLVDGPVLRDKQNWDKLRSAILGLTAALPAFVTAIEALPQVIEWQDKAMDKRIRHSIQQRESRDAAKAAEGGQRFDQVEAINVRPKAADGGPKGRSPRQFDRDKSFRPLTRVFDFEQGFSTKYKCFGPQAERL
jgi:hypothetical protein